MERPEPEQKPLPETHEEWVRLYLKQLVLMTEEQVKHIRSMRTTIGFIGLVTFVAVLLLVLDFLRVF